jgi:putative transcriptional regulator
MDSARGQLLIAGPQLMDRNFWRTVVLIVEHGSEGALGLVLNRPSEATVAETVPELHGILEGDQQMFLGGPVATTSVIVLARFEYPDSAALIAFADVGVLAGDISLDRPQDGVSEGRAFVGHAGWGPGQLDAELERGDWILEPARREDTFAADPEGLWPNVLARKGGSYALLARMPEDPSVN